MLPQVPELADGRFDYAVTVQAGELSTAVVISDLPRIFGTVRVDASGLLIGGRIDIRPNQIFLYLGLTQPAATIQYTSLSFGYAVTQDETLIAEQSWPQRAEVYFSSDQPYLWSAAIGCEPETAYTLTLWSENAGQRFEASYLLATPIPVRPYPSWSWDGSQWQPPVPYPGEGDWEWDEASQQWVPAE